MKQLLIRNIKLRYWTLILYIALIVFYPIYSFIMKPNPLMNSVMAIPLGLILMIMSILDAGHLFRFHRRLGGNRSNLFFGSLPVSKKDMLNANYLTCIFFTLFGAIVITLYGYESDSIQANAIYFSTTYAYIVANFLSIPVAFRKSTEYKTEGVSYIAYIILIMFALPFLLSVTLILINYIFLNHSQIPQFYSYFLNYGFVLLSIIVLIINYALQLNKIKKHTL